LHGEEPRDEASSICLQCFQRSLPPQLNVALVLQIFVFRLGTNVIRVVDIRQLVAESFLGVLLCALIAGLDMVVSFLLSASCVDLHTLTKRALCMRKFSSVRRVCVDCEPVYMLLW
jgi:hypothetical protein